MSLYLGDTPICGGIEGNQLNNPFSLLDYKYSEYELSNASWLLSNGQWNNGAVYTAVYNLLLAIYNGTETKTGVSVKLSTETYADTDFVLNTGDTTFRLPTKVLMAGSKRVAGNGMTLGLTDGTNTFGTSTGQGNSSGVYLMGATSDYGKNVGTARTGSAPVNAINMGVTTDETKSGIETSANGLYLYFYVGETVQDANVIAAGQALTDIANLKNLSNISDNGTSTGASWAMPSDTYDNLTLGASGSTYTAPANGFFVYRANATSATSGIDMYNTSTGYSSGMCYTNNTGIALSASVFARKGEQIALRYINCSTIAFEFVYAQGSEWEKE